jgi:hypothetical protein
MPFGFQTHGFTLGFHTHGFTLNCWHSTTRFCNRWTPCLVQDATRGIRYVDEAAYASTANGSASLTDAMRVPANTPMVLRITGPRGDGFWVRAVVVLAHSWWADRVGIPVSIDYASGLDTYLDAAGWRCNSESLMRSRDYSIPCSRERDDVRDGFTQYFEPIGVDAKETLVGKRHSRFRLLQLGCFAATRAYLEHGGVQRHGSLQAAGQQRAQHAALIAKLPLRPRAEYVRAADDFWSSHFGPGQKVLGMHLRGTDKIQFKEPVASYLPLARAFKCRYPGAAVLVATDDGKMLRDAVVQLLRANYSRSEVVYTNASRGNAPDAPSWTRGFNAAVHARNRHYLKNNTPSPPSKLGRDVLMDTLLLSRSDFLLKAYSTVSEAAIWFNIALHNASFDFDIYRTTLRRRRAEQGALWPAWRHACRCRTQILNGISCEW